MSSSAPSEIASAGPGEMVVGIGSDGDAATLGSLVRTVGEALDRSGRPGCLMVADAGPADRTAQQVREAAGGTRDIVTVEYVRPLVDPLRAPYHGLAGRPAAIRAVLRETLARGSTACLFVDARLTSVTPDWIVRMARPVVADGFDYVAPRYARHTFEGAITKSVVYPVFRALYGARLHQPASVEFACSTRFIQHVLNQGFWEGDEAQTGIGLWLASSAVTGRLRLTEVASGVRTQRAAAEAPDLKTIVTQVVGALFADVEAHVDAWQRIRGSVEVPCVGLPRPPETTAPPVDVEQMLEAFRLGYRALRDVWAWIVRPRTILHLKRLAELPADEFRIGDVLWAEIVYDFALAHRARTMPRDHLLGCFTPLYLAWLAGFVAEVRSRPDMDPDDRLEQLCATFEEKKPYLIAGWRWPERFRV